MASITRTQKLSLIVFSLFIVGWSTFLNGRVFGPYEFGFLVEPATTAVKLRTEGYIDSIQERSPIAVLIFRVMQALTGMTYRWLAIPGVLFSIPMVYALLRPVRRDLRLLSVGAAIGGPLILMPYFYNFRRDAIDILILLSIVVVLLRVDTHRLRRIYGPLVFLGSGFLWLLHYTVWPFFAVFTVVFSILASQEGTLRTRTMILTPAFVLLPWAISAIPAVIYLSSIPILLSLDVTNLTDLIFSFGGSTAIDLKGQTITWDRPSENRFWSRVNNVASVLLFGAFGVLTTAHVLRDRHKAAVLTTDRRRMVLVAVAGAFAVTTALYVLRGYIFRGVYFWPIALSLLIAEYWRVGSTRPRRIAGWLPEQRVVVTVVVVGLLLTVHLSPLAIAGFHNSESHAKPTAEQWETARQIEYVPEGQPVYSSLLHASMVLVETDHRLVHTGQVSHNGDNVTIDGYVKPLYFPDAVDCGYLLTAVNDPTGVTTWGGPIPPVNESRYGAGEDLIYENGVDKLYRKSAAVCQSGE